VGLADAGAVRGVGPGDVGAVDGIGRAATGAVDEPDRVEEGVAENELWPVRKLLEGTAEAATGGC
jgi:hypothetical protein